MPHRSRSRSTARAVAPMALLLAASPLLAACSGAVEYDTSQPNLVADGVVVQSGPVDVIGAVVIAAEPDTGAFAATLVNGAGEEEDALVSLDGGDELMPTDPGEPTPIPTAGRLNLFAEGGIPVSGSFEVGSVVTLTLTFDSGPVTVRDIPVVAPCWEFAPEATGVDVPGAEDYTCEPPSDDPEDAEPEEEPAQ